jgi:cytochrome c-type biogenesis protein CcmE
VSTEVMPYRDDLRALEERRDALESELAHVRHELFLRKLPVLAAPRVQSPCDVPWATMTGDDRVRLCGQCAKYVYNLSAMTRGEAAELLAREPRLCVRYYERADGTILTSDCSLGARKRRIRRVKAAAPAAIVAASLAAVCAGVESTSAPQHFVKSVDEIMSAKPTGLVPVEGDLVHGSLDVAPKATSFILVSNGVMMRVQHAGIVPDTLRDVPGVTVRVFAEGALGEDGVFRSEKVLATGPTQGYVMRDGP